MQRRIKGDKRNKNTSASAGRAKQAVRNTLPTSAPVVPVPPAGAN